MNTTKKLARQREKQREEQLDAERVGLEDPTARPRWRRHTKQMEAMLRGVDPDRFELLASAPI